MARDSVDSPEQKLLGRALKALRQRADMSQEAAGDAFGITGEGWRKYEAGGAKAIFSPDTQSRLAGAVKATREQLLEERARLAGEDPPSFPRAVDTQRTAWVQARAPANAAAMPIGGTVQAGAWLTVDDTGQAPPQLSNVLPDPRFPLARQMISPVRGDSMNLLNIVEGDWVHWVDAIDIGYYPRAGDIVLVERTRFGGQEREVTLKQVEIAETGAVLWPRSTNPRWKSPLDLRADVGEGEEISVEIRGLVLAAIRRF